MMTKLMGLGLIPLATACAMQSPGDDPGADGKADGDTPRARVLHNGVPVTLPEVYTFDDFHFDLTVPPRMSNLRFEVTTDDGDPTMCVAVFKIPYTNGVHALTCGAGFYSPSGVGRNQGDTQDIIEFPQDAEGPWHIALSTDNGGLTNAKLVASYDDEPAGTASSIGNGEATDVSAPSHTSVYYKIEIPDGTDRLAVKIRADASGAVYLRHGELPTQFISDASDVFIDGDPATVHVDGPDAGTWYIAVHGNYDGAHGTLTASY